MIVYLFLVCIVIICCYVEVALVSNDNYDERNSVRVVVAIVCYLLILLIGVLRYEYFGVDCFEYRKYYFDKVENYSWLSLLTNFKIDNGFFIITKIISVMTDDYWIYRAIIYTFTFSCYYYVIVKKSKYVSVGVIVFLGIGLLNSMFFILRQSLAMAICFIAILKIPRKPSISVITILFAITIHKTAIIFLAAICLYYLVRRKLTFVEILVFTGVSYALLSFVLDFIIKTYAGGIYATIEIQGGGYNYFIYLIVEIVLLMLIINKKRLQNDERVVYYFNVSSCTVFVQGCAMKWELLSRIGSYFSMFKIMLVPELLISFSNLKTRIIFLSAIIFIYGSWFIYRVIDNPYLIHTFELFE